MRCEESGYVPVIDKKFPLFQKGMFFCDRARSPHRTTKPSRERLCVYETKGNAKSPACKYRGTKVIAEKRITTGGVTKVKVGEGTTPTTKNYVTWRVWPRERPRQTTNIRASPRHNQQLLPQHPTLETSRAPFEASFEADHFDLGNVVTTLLPFFAAPEDKFHSEHTALSMPCAFSLAQIASFVPL